MLAVLIMKMKQPDKANSVIDWGIILPKSRLLESKGDGTI